MLQLEKKISPHPHFSQVLKYLDTKLLLKKLLRLRIKVELLHLVNFELKALGDIFKKKQYNKQQSVISQSKEKLFNLQNFTCIIYIFIS